MITAVALAWALQAITPGVTSSTGLRTLSVRTAGAAHAALLPVVSRPDGQFAVRADLLTAAVGGTMRRLPNGHFVVAVPGVVLEFVDQSGFVLSATGSVIPLPAPATVDGQVLYLPLSVVADVLPRVATGLLYDPGNSELRIFAAMPSAGRRQFVPTGRPPSADRVFESTVAPLSAPGSAGALGGGGGGGE